MPRRLQLHRAWGDMPAAPTAVMVSPGSPLLGWGGRARKEEAVGEESECSLGYFSVTLLCSR